MRAQRLALLGMTFALLIPSLAVAQVKSLSMGVEGMF